MKSLILLICSFLFLSIGQTLPIEQETQLFKWINSSIWQNNHRNDLVEARTVCYDKHEVGCFTSDGPLTTRLLPGDPDKINTKFIVHQKGKSGHTLVDAFKPDTHKNIPKNAAKVAVLIHGFGGGNGESQDMKALRQALMTVVPVIIVVDWFEAAKNPNYPQASTNTQIIGRQLAVLINKLKASRGLNPDNVHVLGFSLGAQVSGFAGKWARDSLKWKFGRISGIDAAAPLFEGRKGAYLTRDDAKFVDGLHTSAGDNILKGEVGFKEAFAHVDFYPNGGVKQPKCGSGQNNGCNHSAAVVYYTASLTAKNKCRFKAYKCKSWAEFEKGSCKNVASDQEYGYEAAKMKGRGVYYLKTSKDYPFCNV